MGITGHVKFVLAVASLLIFSLAFQGSRGLWERDEGRYTNIALQMLKTGDFIVPAFNDDVPHFAKPPFTYWAIAGGISLLGWNEWGARLPNALAFTATIIMVFALARRITPERKWLPPLIYATFVFPYIASNIITTDTLLTFWEVVAVLGFVESWHQNETQKWAWPQYLMWCGFGLAFLTKGPPGLLPLLAIIVFMVVTKGWRIIPKFFSISGIMLFVVIGFGWYLLVAVTHSGLMTYFIRDEIVNRIGSGMHHRNPQWYKPFVIYLPVLMLGTLPWSIPLLREIRSIPHTLCSREWWWGKLEHDKWPVFLFLWVSIPLLVFFLSSSRLPLYILPLFVPLSLIVGRLTILDLNKAYTVYLIIAWVLFLVVLKLAGSFYPYAKDSREMARAIQAYVHPLPQEIVFIDSEPFWGLNLYLHSEVERVSMQTPSTAIESSEELLSEELLECEPETLFVVDKRKEDQLIISCRRLGFNAIRQGGHGSWVFLYPARIPEQTLDKKASAHG